MKVSRSRVVKTPLSRKTRGKTPVRVSLLFLKTNRFITSHSYNVLRIFMSTFLWDKYKSPVYANTYKRVATVTLICVWLAYVYWTGNIHRLTLSLIRRLVEGKGNLVFLPTQVWAYGNSLSFFLSASNWDQIFSWHFDCASNIFLPFYFSTPQWEVDQEVSPYSFLSALWKVGNC